MYAGKLRLFTCGILNPLLHKNKILWTSVTQALSRQCYQICAVKNSISPDYGLLEFLKLKKIWLEVFLNFFPCVYLNIFLVFACALC